MNGIESLLELIKAFDYGGVPYIEKWCEEHGRLEVLAEAKVEADRVREDDAAGG
ncbi:MAG: hypothetical protein ABI600_09885 [Luteolibacter sp.]